jgi:hypothetical protein
VEAASLKGFPEVPGEERALKNRRFPVNSLFSGNSGGAGFADDSFHRHLINITY